MKGRTLAPLYDSFDAFFFMITIANIRLMVRVIAAPGFLAPKLGA